MNAVDASLSHWVNGFAGGPLDLVMIALTHAAIPVMVLAVVLSWWSAAERVPNRHTAVAAGLSFLGGLLLNQLIVLAVFRVRPYDAGVTQLIVGASTDSSFPSDHATAAFAIAASVAFSGKRLRAAVFAVAALLLAVSRVYVGIHYVGDILAGALTGITASALVHATYRTDSRLARALVRVF